jgi:hypothetical protein
VFLRFWMRQQNIFFPLFCKLWHTYRTAPNFTLIQACHSLLTSQSVVKVVRNSTGTIQAVNTVLGSSRRSCYAIVTTHVEPSAREVSLLLIQRQQAAACTYNYKYGKVVLQARYLVCSCCSATRPGEYKFIGGIIRTLGSEEPNFR